MKHLKIIFTLTLVVLSASIMVFYVEAWTTPKIDEYNLAQANAAKLEVLPTLVVADLVKSDGVTPIDPVAGDFTGSTIIELLLIPGKGYIYTAEFSGYQSKVRYMIALDNDGLITGFKTLIHGETAGYGSTIADEVYRLQFEGLSQEDAISGNIDDVAGLSGAPVTMGAFRESLKGVVQFHQSTYEGVEIETPEARQDRLVLAAFPTADRFVDIKADFAANDEIEILNEVYDADDTLLGYLYYVNTVGVSFSEVTYIKFFVGFNLDKEITGFAILDDNETAGKTTNMYLDEYGQAFVGDIIDSADYGIDDISGSTMSNDLIQDVVREIAGYHNDFVTAFRPENVDVVNADLLKAFPEGVTFTSVYSDLSYNESIGNIYEVYDAGDILLGYVYYSTFFGFNTVTGIEFVLGIDVLGNTNLIEILNSSESWGDAVSYSNYDGLSGYFPDVEWLDNFEAVSVLELIIDPVDDIAGVSTTTGNMLETIQGILQYHLFEVVGGAN